MSELLPCPFCGGTDGDLVQTFTRATDEVMWWAVECCNCSAEVTRSGGESEAVAAWNTRTASQEPNNV